MKKAEGAAAYAGLLNAAWGAAKSLFDYRKVDETLKQRLPGADLRSAVVIFVAAMLLGAVLSLIIYIESLYFAAFSYKTLAELAGSTVEPQPDFSTLGQFALFLALSSAIVFLACLFQDGIAYYALRLTGGKGTFTRQYYLSSLVALSMAISSAIMIFGVVPCAGALAFFAYVAMTLYLMFWVRCRAYAMVHGLSGLHVFVIVFLSCIPTVALLLAANGAAAGALHLPQAAYYNMSGV
ncbi:MAG: hypothetical protein PHV13_04680 [Candidatus ainarchaeum sp.]|nr:hypothetical protein [Candidatus ainarchaeum sp.]